VNYLIPVAGVVLGAVVLGERIDAAVLAGGALVIAGVAIAGGAGGARATRLRLRPSAARAPGTEPIAA